MFQEFSFPDKVWKGYQCQQADFLLVMITGIFQLPIYKMLGIDMKAFLLKR